MKCPICKSEGKDVDISDEITREEHARTHGPGMTSQMLEDLAQPSSGSASADPLPDKIRVK